MQVPRHTLDQLLVLEAIVETGSFAAAARSVHRVPSAISYTVRALEEGLGITVFDRSGHRAVLTDAGRRVHEAGAEVLRQARALDGLARSLEDGWEPELQVVLDGLYPMAPVTQALKALSHRGVPTRVRVDVEFQDGVHERFHADHAAMMLVLELEVEAPYLGTPLPELNMVLVTAPDHPIAGRRALSRPDLLTHVELVVKDSSSKFAATPRRPFSGSPNVIYLSDFQAKRLGIVQGAGFGWLPTHLAQDDLDSGRLVMSDMADGNAWTYHPHLITRRDEPLGRAGALFRETFLTAAHQ